MEEAFGVEENPGRGLVFVFTFSQRGLKKEM
jgi:hypothetical protein